jgi:hypothetical protein
VTSLRFAQNESEDAVLPYLAKMLQARGLFHGEWYSGDVVLPAECESARGTSGSGE